MQEKFKNKYRIPSTRLPYWDYGWNAAYFVTICTQNREHFFLVFISAKMQLSEIGELVEKYWSEIPQHFRFVKLDAFVIMPNHIHGIIIIDKPDDGANVKTPNVETPNLGVSTKPHINDASKKWKSGTLGVVINQFKRICTINTRVIIPRFAWQSRFYDHVIRSEKSYYRIIEYIHSNPKRWQKDR